MDLNLLEVLRVVLAEQHVARAAARLHVTPSAVSNALARLRDQFGDPLVVKKGRGIVPTPMALAIQPILERNLAGLTFAIAAVKFQPHTTERTFTLALADVGQIAWGPAIAQRFARNLPRAHLRLLGIDALLAFGDLGSPEIDLHVGIPPQGPSLHVAPLVDVESVIVARADHPLARRALTAKQVRALRHVQVDLVPHKRFPDPFAHLFGQRDIAITVQSFSAAAAIVAATDYVTMLPRPMVGDLRVLRAPIAKHAIGFAMAWHDRTHDDPSSIFFRSLVRSAVKGT